MKYLTLITGLCLAASLPLQAQQAPIYKNSIGGELGGPSLLSAFTYERTLVATSIFALNARAGLSIGMFSIEPNALLYISNRFAIEAGVAYTYFHLSIHDGGLPSPDAATDQDDSFLFLRGGIRTYLGQNQKTYLKLGYTPFWLISRDKFADHSFKNWFGLGFGIGF